MKRSKFSEEQVAYALRHVEAGTPVGDVCRQLGVSEATFYAWKKKYAPPRCERATPRVPARARKCAAEASGRGRHSPQAHVVGGSAKKRVTPARRRELAGWFQGRSRSAACRPVGWRGSVGPCGIGASVLAAEEDCADQACGLGFRVVRVDRQRERRRG